MDKFCDILKDLIDESGLKLREIEKASGIPSSQMSRYLKSTIPTVAVAERIAKYFDCSFDYLFGLTEVREHKKFKDCDLTVFLPRYEKALKENHTTHWKFCYDNKMNESLLRHWKKGEVPRFDNLIIIAKNLSVSLDYLLGRI